MALSTTLARALFKKIIDCFSDEVFYLNQAGLVEEVNEAARRTFSIDAFGNGNCSLVRLLGSDIFADLADRHSFRWKCLADAGENIMAP